MITSCQKEEKEINLFNIKNLSDWHIDAPRMDTIPDNTNPFVVRKGMLVSLEEPKGHLITDKSYLDYKLSIEYRLHDRRGNYGVFGSCFQTESVV
ncbi:family 16 glycoside hydrolase [Maribacter sp. X9]|uniref:family 16 glycoside hydrolase n=1 Tax=Maribacter sp. X9 TaxID=3402159 RepID=UPI003AF40193